jgi:GGDEF domain-containing protein
MIWVAVLVLTKLNARLRAAAHTDGLTGLLNRTGFAVAAARTRAVAERRGETLVLAVIDLDDFKLVNDRDGHLAGDRMLLELAGAWTASLRPGDLLGRFGGDEFVLLVSERSTISGPNSWRAWLAPIPPPGRPAQWSARPGSHWVTSSTVRTRVSTTQRTPARARVGGIGGTRTARSGTALTGTVAAVPVILDPPGV